MANNYIEEKTFNQVNFIEEPMEMGNYENCTFNLCNFSEINLSGISFTDCRFTECNLTMAKLGNTVFRDVHFNNCKLLGLHFHDCNPFIGGLNFENCLMNLCSFYKLKIKKTIFNNCNLTEADFTETDASESKFIKCDLAQAVFNATNLEKSDFSSAYNFSINPENNKIKKAKFSIEGLAGLLDRYQIIIE